MNNMYSQRNFYAYSCKIDLKLAWRWKLELEGSSIRVTNALSRSCSYIHHFHKKVYRDAPSITTDSPFILPSDVDVLAICTSSKLNSILQEDHANDYRKYLIQAGENMTRLR